MTLIYVLDCETMKTFNSSRWYPVQPEAVFHAIESPELLARWWGPKDFTCTFEVFDFRAGGQWKFVMHGPDGTDYPNLNQFTVIEPNRVAIRHIEAPLFTATLNWKAERGGTSVDWSQVFDQAVSSSVADVIKPSNEQLLDKLGEVLG